MNRAHAAAAAGGDDASAGRPLPPLLVLRCFAVAARTASFNRAAEELCVTRGAISRQLLLLEEFYGQPLFIRGARGLVLRLLQGPSGLRQPARLADHVLLHAAANHDDWRRWLRAAGLHDIDCADVVDFRTLDRANSAAAQACGVALGDRMIARPAIESGRLCAPFDLDVATGHGHFLHWQAAWAERPENRHLIGVLDAALHAPTAASAIPLIRHG